jgi:hypothetical protein
MRWFIVEVAEEAVTGPEENRRYVCLPLAEAKRKAMLPETQTLLERAAGHQNLWNA